MKPQRVFIPGSECVYFKIYTGKKIADDFLIKAIDPLVHQLIRKDYIRKWFFLRFEDPKFHIRLRLFVKTDRVTPGEVIDVCCPYLFRWSKDNFIHRIQLDTYVREIERYGEETIEESEYLFYKNSECVMAVLKYMSMDENLRWMFSIEMVNCIIGAFGLELREKQQFMEKLCSALKAEFGFNQYNSKQFNRIFRDHRRIIEQVLQRDASLINMLDLYNILSSYIEDILGTIQCVSKKKATRQKDKFNHYLACYIHMAMNRLFPDKARIHELIVYDMLNRYYVGELARLKYKINQ